MIEIEIKLPEIKTKYILLERIKKEI